MDNKEKEIRTRIAEEMGRLSEAILRREHPFDTLSAQSEVMPHLYIKYLQYYNDLEEGFRRSIFTSLVDQAKWQFHDVLLGTPQRFNSLYPQHVSTQKLFGIWIDQREGPQGPIILHARSLPEGTKVNQIVKRVLKKRKPEFSYEKSFGVPGLIVFSKRLDTDNRVYLAVDRGTMRRSLSFLLGLAKPRLLLDVASFFSNSQSWYRYTSAEEVESSVNKALDLIEKLLPYFEGKVKRALAG
jgi:hypothetical protein